MIDVTVHPTSNGSLVVVRVEQSGTRTEHRVTVTDEDLARYRATSVADLVRRSFEFLLEREPNTSILRKFRITEIEGYFPEYATTIRRERR